MSPHLPLVHTITASDMKAINRSAILEMVRRYGPVSRTEIARTLHVSLPTVMRIVNELEDENLVRPSGEKEWSGGRKRSLVEFNGEEHLVIGIDLGGTKIYGAVADLCGNIRFETDVTQHNTQQDGSYDLVVQLISELLSHAQSIGVNVRGIGLGVPGVTRPDTGIVEHAPALQWKQFPLRQKLETEFKLPIVIENDVNLAALGELWFGVEKQIDNLILIAIGTGIGAGIIINGMVYPGNHFSAGEIGYLLPDRTHLNKEYSDFGALEMLASGTGITNRARKHLESIWPPEKILNLSTERVFQEARLNEPWAVEVLDETIDYLALAIASVSLCFDPDLILLGGGVSRSADLLINPIKQRLEKSIPTLPPIQASELGYRAAVLGAIVKLLRMTTEYYWWQKYS